MNNYDISFLEEKLGIFDKESKYPRISLIEGSLYYIEEDTKDNLLNILKIIKKDNQMNPIFIWGYVKQTDSIYVTRSFGENKIFTFNPRMKKTEYVKGKVKVLKQLNENNINDLFDQKVVFNHFYKKLWDIRINLAKDIINNNNISHNIALSEAQTIIDRIIFVYFLCEKKLISVNDFGTINGNQLFSDILIKENNVWNILKELFFEQLAKQHDNYLNCNDVLIKIPYLNGGLFRSKIIEEVYENDLIINYDWNDLFKLLNSYTWMINDDIHVLSTSWAEEYNGNLTPEILGHIYEKFVITIENFDELDINSLSLNSKGNLKEGNKNIGAYYTPEKITHFITKKTINDFFYNKFLLDISKIDSLSDEELESLLIEVNNITICDPSCGSGAFILKAGEQLLDLKIKIYTLLNKKFNEYHLKRDIIINNLFGVDIKEEATEICKLRLWLWLIASNTSNKIDTLPNIEYNIMKGNSLIGWIDESLDQTIFLDNNLFMVLSALKIGLNEKQQNILSDVEKLLKTRKISDYSKALSYLKSVYSYSYGETAEQLKKMIDQISSQINKSITQSYLEGDQETIGRIDFNLMKDIKFFHWKSEFYDIINNGGFDIIVGNPPYGTKVLNEEEKKFADKRYIVKRNDIAALFIERSISLLNENGYLGYIITNAITYNKKFSKARNLIFNNFEKCFISSFDRDKCRFFEGVTLSVSIMFCSNKKENSKCNFYTSKSFRETPNNLNEINYKQSNNFNISNKIGVSYNSDHRIAKIGDSIAYDILNKITNNEFNCSDIIQNGDIIWIRVSGNYWYNSWTTKPYSNSKIKELNIDKIYKNLFISIINSSLFYFWMRVYGDGRDLSMDILNLFPIKKINSPAVNILFKENVERLMFYLFENFDNKKNRFTTSNVKPILDISDILLGKLYELTNDEIKYILNYNDSIRGGQKISNSFFIIFEMIEYLIKNNLENSETYIIVKETLNKMVEEAYFNNLNNNRVLFSRYDEIFEEFQLDKMNLDLIIEYSEKLKE